MGATFRSRLPMGSQKSAAMETSESVPHSSSLRLHRLKDAPATFFVTKTLQPKKPVLGKELRAIVADALAFCVGEERIILRAFVVMPDHWHAAVGLLGQWTLPRFMHSIMSHVGSKTAGALRQQGVEWQEGYYDTRIRSLKQLQFVASYILQNPVRKRLVARTEDWDAVSARFPGLVTDQWPWLLEKD